MRVVTVARKPLSEGSVVANVLKHGTGAINIDATRVSFKSEADLEATTKLFTGTHGHRAGMVTQMFGQNDKLGDHVATNNEVNTLGRWPANLILVHKSGCLRIGTNRIKGVLGGTGNHDGTKTVPSWDCVSGCPVTALDSDSGVLTSGGRAGSVYGDGLKHKTSPAISDKGGASRFFKTI